MSVRKRTWLKGNETRVAWVVDYTDQGGKRRLKTFRLKKEADAFEDRARTQVREGVHVADSASATVREAGKLWLAAKEKAGRERTTIDQYRNHVQLHINPCIGETKLTALTPAAVRAFEDALLDGSSDGKKRSPAMVRKIMVSLGSLLADARERGLIGTNVVRDMRGRRSAADSRAERRAKGKLKIGVDIPPPNEMRLILGALTGRWRPILMTAALTGLRASELRGLIWANVDLQKGTIHVRQRADRFKKIGRPKSEAGERSVPIPPTLQEILTSWKKSVTASKLGLCFPNLQGEPEAHGPIAIAFQVAQVRAGVTTTTTELDADGNSITVARYKKLHSLRHFYASWCINRRVDGGLELPPKMVQERLGHATINMTLDVYGHLFPSGDDGSELAAAEAALFNAT